MNPEPYHTYIIKGGQQGADRLAILANVMWPFTLPFLQNAGLREGMKCLDVGCGNGEITKRIASIIGPGGHITGVDFDPSVINIAENGGGIPDNVQFKVMDIETEAPEHDTYDFIFCRFILSHLQSPLSALEKLNQSLRTDGIMAVEDVDFRGHFSHPPSHAFDTYVHWYEQVGRSKGANPFIGPSILEMLSLPGYEDIKMNVVLPTFYNGDGKRMALLTLKAIRDAVISADIATEEEVDIIIDELERYTNEDLSMMSLPRIFQVSSK